MNIEKKASANWKGNLKEGKGTLTTESGALKEQPYGFNTRFEGKAAGTNPEELIGAAHAGCFSMAFSMMLGESDLEAKNIDTEAKVTLEESSGGFSITKVDLKMKVEVPGAEESKVKEIAEKAKENCPVSKLLNSKINLDFEFVS